jgi:hypothetical protein
MSDVNGSKMKIKICHTVGTIPKSTFIEGGK